MTTGFVVINKPAGVSSAKEVAAVKRIVGVPCGHMGTLDPMASGVLPVAIGNAARLFDYFLDKKKKYTAEFIFGEDSDTLDTTGNVVSNGEYVPSYNEIENVLPSFCGEILQVPPKYSAKNVNGVRSYRLAREGAEFELSPKKVTVYSIKLLDKTSDNSYSFEIECGGGTYIRSLARDIGKRLGTCAIMSSLIRTESGIFRLCDSVKSENLNKDNINSYTIKTQDVLPYDNIKPSAQEEKKLLNGLSVESNLPDGIYKFFRTDDSFYGLAEVRHNILKVRTKLC